MTLWVSFVCSGAGTFWDSNFSSLRSNFKVFSDSEGKSEAQKVDERRINRIVISGSFQSKALSVLVTIGR